MGERGADNAPGPARCRRHSLAGPAGGRGVGVAEGGQGSAEVMQTKSVLSAPARTAPGASGPGCASKPDLGAGPGNPHPAPPPGNLPVCAMRVSWAGRGPSLRRTGLGNLGLEFRFPALPPNLSVLACVMGTLPR